MSPQFEEGSTGNKGLRELRLAQLIVENSPRLAADDPKQRKMVCVSPDIDRFGYRAEVAPVQKAKG